MIVTTAVLCMAINIYHEARSEPIPGQVAVAYVTLNRAQQQQKPICDVVFQNKQFSWTNGRYYKAEFGSGPDKLVLNVPDANWAAKYMIPKDRKSWDKAMYIAKKVLAGKSKDNTNGSTFYHTTQVKPIWRHSLQKVSIMGRHIFYKKKKRTTM